MGCSRAGAGTGVPTAADPWVVRSQTAGVVADGQKGSGVIDGQVSDEWGGVLPGATVRISNPLLGIQEMMTGVNGDFMFVGLPPGHYDLQCELWGFTTYVQKAIAIAIGGHSQAKITLRPTTAAETITVTAEQPLIDTKKTGVGTNFTQETLGGGGGGYSYSAPKEEKHLAGPTVSAGVLNLQRRVSGVLPIRVDVPRAGTSYRFIRPLVLDEETTVTFAYSRRRSSCRAAARESVSQPGGRAFLTQHV